ncbi:hypothetical protein MDUV_33090 [Mycolicibacterium duvalii]|uniref:Uncharacterized protein n=1 Tax=Mycolicibacterium duvalii TaxID=39688 RepID=A0A7I7K4R4_9MYCO|nr:hypothetical protein MDUV_33090 [Mycolicibacterium duvalii]
MTENSIIAGKNSPAGCRGPPLLRYHAPMPSIARSITTGINRAIGAAGADSGTSGGASSTTRAGALTELIV